MKVLGRFFVAGLAVGAFLVGTSVATAQDFGCTATPGSGTNAFNLGVTGVSMPVGGFVAGFQGGTITTFTIDGFSGSPDSSGLPSGTSLGVFVQIPAGSQVVIHVITSAPPAGAFSFTYINQAQTGYGPLFSCPLETPSAGPGTPPTGAGGGILVSAGDFNGDGVPDLLVTTPGPGSLDVNPFFVRSTNSARKSTPLVQAVHLAVKKAGKVKVILHPTAAGKALLVKSGKFTTTLKVTFTPTGGTPSSKTVKVTFKKK